VFDREYLQAGTFTAEVPKYSIDVKTADRTGVCAVYEYVIATGSQHRHLILHHNRISTFLSIKPLPEDGAVSVLAALTTFVRRINTYRKARYKA
jgi:hypothetical protein